MAGTGRTPKDQLARPSNAKQRIRGQWQPTESVGWQHGKTPAPPTGLLPSSRRAWKTWMDSWFAAHWTPDDVPGLLVVILLYDQIQRQKYERATELRLQMDTYGITPKGQQDRRWKAPEKAPQAPQRSTKYGHLEAVEL